MSMMAGRNARSSFAALVAGVAVTLCGEGARAQPPAEAASEPKAAVTPARAASGAPGAAQGCSNRPELCRALHAANKALIAAVKANKEGKYVCTSLNHQPGCSTTSPQPYLKYPNPYGNPGDVDEGRRLLDWYLKNQTCEELCKPKKDVQACMQACGQGKDPTGSAAKPGQPTKLH